MFSAATSHMKEDTKKLLRQAAQASTIGLTLVFAIFIGLALGIWLDGVFGTSPWLTLVCFVMGLAAGFLNYYRFTKKQGR